MNKLTCMALHWTWCLPQTLLGWIVYRWVKFRDKNCIIDECTHKSGHSVQSLILGPLYLIIIGIPSSMFAANITAWAKKSYYWFYTEKWADSIMGIDDDRDRKHGNQRPGAFWKKRNKKK